jgi:hypothetical protein
VRTWARDGVRSRKLAGLTKVEVARPLGLTLAWVSKCETRRAAHPPERMSSRYELPNAIFPSRPWMKKFIRQRRYVNSLLS